MWVKKFAFLLRWILRFSAENILRLFKNRSGRGGVDQNDIKFVFCMKNWFLGFIIPLTVISCFLNEVTTATCSCYHSLEAVVHRYSSKFFSFADFTEKNLWIESLFHLMAGLQTCYVSKNRLQHRCCPMKFAKFLRIQESLRDYSAVTILTTSIFTT